MKIIYFDDSIEKFIKSLENRSIAKSLKIINLLEEFGNDLRMPYSKKLTEDIFELRINSKQEVRILYTFYKNNAVLLTGFIKNSNKVPQREISKALNKVKRLD